MEAISQMTSARELLACCREYWETGRARMTSDVVAAAQGLLDAGVREVIVLDNHGSGHPQNVIGSRLPRGARLETWEVYGLAERDVADAMLQVGYHPRSGLSGFVAHTYTVGLRMWSGGEEISESHGRAWASGLPLLGITGHSSHGATLGSLDGTKFISVQEGREAITSVAMTGEAEGLDRIRAFARECAEGFADAPTWESPRDEPFRVALRSAASDVQAAAFSSGGFARVGDREFECELAHWNMAERPLKAAMAAAMAPFMDDFRVLDMSSAEAVAGQDPRRIARVTDAFMEAIAAPWD